MADPLNRPNAVLIQAVLNPAGIPEAGDTNNPTVLLSTDADGNLRTSAVAVIGGSVEISNDVGNPVPVNGTVEITNDVGNAIPISAATLPLPTGAATAALQTQPGVDIGDVTVNNAAGAAAVNVQDGGNSLTVDGTVTQAQADTVPQQFTKTVADPATPEPLAADGTFFKTAILIANKAPRTPNVGVVYLGVTAGNDTQPIALNTGAERTISAPEGQRYDLNDFYLDVVTAADGVVVIYS